jgi:hypothetical protein
MYKSMIENALQTEFFYFSRTYDLTHSLQRLHEINPDYMALPLFERVRLVL